MLGDLKLSLSAVDDDVLISLFSFLSVPDILALRQVCKRFATLSRLYAVWRSACITHVLQKGIPCPPLSSISKSSELELITLRALRIERARRCPSYSTIRPSIFQASASSAIAVVRFLPIVNHRQRIVTVSKGIWSSIICWDLGSGFGPTEEPREVAKWSPRGALFLGLAVNSDPLSDALLAVSISMDGWKGIHILALRKHKSGLPMFESIKSVETAFQPVTLQGEIIAFSDHSYTTQIVNWKTEEQALLDNSEPNGLADWNQDSCLKLVFAYESVLVVRARSISLFAQPKMVPQGHFPDPQTPIARHSFGWIDGVAVATCASDSGRRASHESLTILLRAESDDPWSSDIHTLEKYILEFNPDYVSHNADGNPEVIGDARPYVFPPRLQVKVPSLRGFLRCTDLALGPCGTAVWISPYQMNTLGLVAVRGATNRSLVTESVVATIFPNPLRIAAPDSFISFEARRLWHNDSRTNGWTSLDYDEQLGRIVLGSSDGHVTLLDLGAPQTKDTGNH